MLHIDIPTLAEFKALAATKDEACVSLYVPTSPLHDQAQANRIAFKDLAEDALAQLREAGIDKRGSHRSKSSSAIWRGRSLRIPTTTSSNIASVIRSRKSKNSGRPSRTVSPPSQHRR